MLVCCPERLNILLAGLASIHQVAVSPGKGFRVEHLAQKYISHHAGMPAISIWKQVDPNKSMMKPVGDFIYRVGFILYPKPDII